MNLFLSKIVNEWANESGKSIGMAIEDVAKVFEIEKDELEKSVRNAPIDIPMSGADVARELNITRQNTSQILKRALRKVFYFIRKNDPEMSDFEVACYVSEMLGVDKKQDEMIKFFKLFPKEIKGLIRESGMNQWSNNIQDKIRKEEKLEKERISGLQAMQKML